MLNEKLMRLVKECENELKSISLDTKLNKRITYEVNYKAKKRLGQCCYNGLDYVTINISSWLLESFSDKDVKNTIMHEIIHTFDDCNNHGSEWQRYANMVNRCLGYNIKRLCNINELCKRNDIDIDTFNNRYKYEITCKTCGRVFHTYKMSAWTKTCYKSGNCTHRSCGGHTFKVVDLKENKVICDD